MKLLENEKILYQSKNKRLILTSHRIREMDKSRLGSRIKSIMLEELTSCELRTIRSYGYVRYAILLFLILNGGVYFLNNYLFEAELMRFFYGEVHIGPATAGKIFYASLLMVLAYIALFMFSVKKVFSFHTSGMTIDMHIRWLDFEERENFISEIEKAKDERIRSLSRLPKS